LSDSPRKVFDRMAQGWLGHGPADGTLLAEDVVLEAPFASPDQPARIEGRDNVLAFTNAGRAAFPLHLDTISDVLVHQTIDAETIVVEYRLGGRLPDGSRRSAPFIGVLQVRNGRALRWREYQDKAAITAAITAAATQAPTPYPPKN
jgi:ketosteroid isomerase-like protein